MKAYVTSIGERTTQVCMEQLERFGFEPVLIDGMEEWPQKYARFLEMADENCIRVDADVIINSNAEVLKNDWEQYEMVQFKCYDFYRNNIGIAGPVYYRKSALEIIRTNFDKLDLRRPEATAWRLNQIRPYTHTDDTVVGMHGFFQDFGHLLMAKKNKKDRKQMHEYDFELAQKLILLIE